MPKILTAKRFSAKTQTSKPIDCLSIPSWLKKRAKEQGIPESCNILAYEWHKSLGPAKEFFLVRKFRKTIILKKTCPDSSMFRKEISWYTWGLPTTELELKLSCKSKEAWKYEEKEEMIEVWRLNDGRMARVHRKA